MCGLCGGGAIIGAQCGHLEPLVVVDASETWWHGCLVIQSLGFPFGHDRDSCCDEFPWNLPCTFY